MARHSLGFIYVTVALDALAMGIVIPVLPRLIGTLTNYDAPNIALAVGVLATLFALTQFFAAPIIGALSDRFGRRPIVLAANASLAIDFAIMAFAPNLIWLAAGRFLSGIAAGSGPAAFAYVADVTPQSKRGAALGKLFGAQALGATLGPALGGLLSSGDIRAPFWAAAILCLLNTLYGLFVLPESLPPEKRARFDWAHANPIGAIVWLARAYPQALGMIVVAFLLSFASQGANSLTVLYTEFRYGWTPQTIGIVLTIFGIASLAVQAGLVTPITRRLGERATFISGLSLTTAGLFLFGAAPTGALFCAALPLLALGAICGPVMGGYFSAMVADHEQGRLQGAWSGVNAAMGLLAPGAFTALYATSISGAHAPAPGAAFYAAAAILTLALLLATKTWRSPRRSID
ncbi:MAG: MFS transporter [Hyphomonadaceae bacterium]|nr:MFS transporter [Hyphomonadaceae bacterium]